MLLAAAVFRLWDGRTLEAVDWVRHGEEYVVTLSDGRVLILREQHVREVMPGAGRGTETSGEEARTPR